MVPTGFEPVFSMISEGVAHRLTLLLHKPIAESAAYYHKMAVSDSLMIFFKDSYLGDPVDYVDLTALPLWSKF